MRVSSATGISRFNPTPPPDTYTQLRKSLSHLFSLSSFIVSIILKLGFSKTYYFSLILDFLKIAKIAPRIPRYPAPSLPECQHLTYLCAVSGSARSPSLRHYNPNYRPCSDATSFAPSTPFLFWDPTLHLVVMSPWSPAVWGRYSAFPCPQ